MKRRLRVVTLINTVSRLGGAERLAANVVLRLDAARFERIVCTTRPPPGPTFDDELRAAGVRVLGLARSSRSELIAWWPLISLLQRERIDILHAHKFGSNVWGTVLGRLLGVPVVIAHEHTWSFEGQPLRRLLDRELIARGADVLVAVSREDRRKMIEVEGIDPGVIRWVPNGIPPLPPASHDIRSALGVGADAPLIGTVSVLREQKALEVLIASAALLAPRFPGLKVVVVGRGPEEAKLRRQVTEAGLDDVVMLLGPRTDVPDILAGLDVAVCCSDFEGSPLSVMEYMAAGKAVAATRVGGVPDLIEHGVHGLLVPRRDVGGLADAVARLLRDPLLRAEMGARGRERQRRHFDLDGMVERVELLYEQLFLATERARREASAFR